MCRVESFADDLNLELGTVSGRVALLLRSAEVKPMLHRFVQRKLNFLLPYHPHNSGPVFFSNCDLAVDVPFLLSLS
jgi:hypothetical protein